MMNKNQEKQSTDAQDPNGELISTVTATVLQILKATDQISGESRECKNNKKEPETVDLTGMFFLHFGKILGRAGERCTLRNAYGHGC